MKKFHGLPTALGLMALVASCATQAPPLSSASSAAPLPPAPAGSQRLPGTITCENEVSCSACADDDDRERVKLSFIVHAAEVRACYDRVATTQAGDGKRVTFRLGIDPTGAAGSSCIVRWSQNDTDVERCVADLLLKWRFPPPKTGGWALVDVPFTLGRVATP